MDEQPLVRIGPGVPPKPAPQPRRKWFGIRPEFVIAAAVLIAMGSAITAGYVFGPPHSDAGTAASPPARPAAVEVECANIRHAYANWRDDLSRLRGIPEMRVEPAKLELKRLTENGKEFLRVASGHEDRPSKALAAAVAQYNADIGFVALELQLGDTIELETYEKAIASWKAADASYSSFLALTCS